MTDPSILAQARAAVADRYAHDFTKRAIIGGHWDGGQLVRGEYDMIVLRNNMADALSPSVSPEEITA